VEYWGQCEVARVLSRPMFRRGGSTNSGIVSGFKGGGKVRQGYKHGEEVTDYADILKGYIDEPKEQKGLTSSDWLRIAAAGANIMGAPSSGRDGWIGALQAASPALSDLGIGLAESKDARRANYLTRKNAYDAALGQAALTGASDRQAFKRQEHLLEKGHEHQSGMQTDQFGHQVEMQEDAQEHSQEMQDAQLAFQQASLDAGFAHDFTMAQTAHDFRIEELQIEFDNAVDLLIKDKELSPYDFEKQYILGEGAKLIEIMSNSITGSKEYEDAKTAFLHGLHGETVRANTEEKANLLMDTDFANTVQDLADAIHDSEEINDPNSPYYQKRLDEIATMIRGDLFRQVISEIHIPEGLSGNAKGGTPIRRKYALGGTDSFGESYREKEAVNVPEPGDENIEFSFVELRKRLPPEVTDAVINLILNSEEAMIDFAKLQTQEDVSIFNQKYNSDLQIPQQVA